MKPSCVRHRTRSLIAEAERLLDAADYGDDLLQAIATLRLMEAEFGLLVMLPPGDDWTDRYDVCLQAWKELRCMWHDGDVAYRPPPLTETPTEALIADLREVRVRFNVEPASVSLGTRYDALVAELERRGVNIKLERGRS